MEDVADHPHAFVADDLLCLRSLLLTKRQELKSKTSRSKRFAGSRWSGQGGATMLIGSRLFVNQRIIERLKYCVRENLQAIKAIGGFARPSATHINATLRVSLKTLEWLENPKCTDVDEFSEISKRQDYLDFVKLCNRAVLLYTQTVTEIARNIAIRSYTEQAEEVLRAFRESVESRRSVMESLDDFVHSEESVQSFDLVQKTVIGDGARQQKLATSLFLSSWSKFLTRLKGTIWDVDPNNSNFRFVRLVRTEQRLLVRYKLVRDPQVGDHHLSAKNKPKDDEAIGGQARLLRSSRLTETTATDTTNIGEAVSSCEDGDEDPSAQRIQNPACQAILSSVRTCP